MRTFHLAYPNVIPRDRKFLGCGRYLAAPLNEAPDNRYVLVELNIPNLTEVHLAALQLAPESGDSKQVIYERIDPSPHPYRGESRDLAYVLALISRSRRVKFAADVLPGDLWCTGAIDIKGDQSPFLKAVDAAGFTYKLHAFLADHQPDRIFIAPAANLLPIHEALFLQRNVQVVSLGQFRPLSDDDLAACKTIVKVRPDELAALIAGLFLPPTSTMPLQPARTDNPYRGLFPFREQDAANFFGRDTAIRQIVAALEQHPLIAVLGSSGSGKSSLIAAGVVPFLHQHGPWRVFVLRPGSNPAQTLATGLQTVPANVPGIKTLVVIDQFEELYTLCDDDGERRRFLDLMLRAVANASPTWHIIIALRADFLGKACTYRPLADALQKNTQLLGPMTHAELRAVLERPAERCGIAIEDGLTERILAAVGDEPGNLPLLSFALTALWETQREGMFTHAAYRSVGGVPQALAVYAEQIYTNLTAPEQAQAQRIFTQLVRPGEGTEDTRRMATRAEIGAESWKLVTQLANARLVVTNRSHAEEIVELVHEALMAGWQRFQRWIDADRQFRMWQERLRTALRQWQASQQDEGGLLRGLLLTEAEQWLAAHHAALTPAEQEFIEASLRLRNQEQVLRKRLRRRYRLVFVVAFLCVLGFALITRQQWQQAEQHRRRAEEQRLLAQARQATAEELRQRAEQQTQLAHESLQRAEENTAKALSQSARALLLSHHDLDALLSGVKAAIIANRLTVLPAMLQHQIRFTLHDVLAGSVELQRLEGHDAPVKNVCFSPDGSVVASSGNDSTIRLWNAAEGREIQRIYAHLGSVKALSFHPNGTLLASGGSDPLIHLWNPATGQRQMTLYGYWRGTRMLQFRPDGDVLAALCDDNTLKFWKVSNGQKVMTIAGTFAPIQAFRFSPDSRLIATGHADHTVTLWDAADGRKLTTRYGHSDSVQSVSFSPDGVYLASGSADRTIKLWSVDHSSELLTLQGHTDGVRSLTFSPDGKLLASGSDDFDGSIKLWEIHAGRELKSLNGHYNSVVSLDFSPDGRLLVSGSDDHQIKVWQIARQPSQPVAPDYAGSVKAVAFHPQESLLAFAGQGDGTVTLWDYVQNRVRLTVYGDSRNIWEISFSPDGRWLAAGNADHTIALWELPAGRQRLILRGHTDAVRSIRFSPDGAVLASGSEDHTVKLWQVATGQELATLSGHHGTIASVAFSPDGALVASASEDATIKLWHVADRRNVLTLTGHGTPVRTLAFHPRGTLLASGGGDNTIRFWTIPGGREMTPLKGHARIILSLAFSADGSLLASGSQDHTLKIWSIPEKIELKGIELTTLEGFTDGVNSLQFSPQGVRLAASSNGSQISLWNFELPGLLQQGCARLHGYLLNNPTVSSEDRGLCQNR